MAADTYRSGYGRVKLSVSSLPFLWYSAAMKTAVSSIFVAVALLTSSALIAEAQQGKIAKIGWLGSRPALREDVSARGSEMIRRELRTLGYVDAKNVTVEYRSAENYWREKMDCNPR